MTPEEQFIKELEASLATLRKLPEVLDGPMISPFPSFQQGKRRGDFFIREKLTALTIRTFKTIYKVGIS